MLKARNTRVTRARFWTLSFDGSPLLANRSRPLFLKDRITSVCKPLPYTRQCDKIRSRVNQPTPSRAHNIRAITPTRASIAAAASRQRSSR